MPLAKRVVPTMLCRGRLLVKGKQFAGDRVIGHVLDAARVHAARGCDELVILDIAATAEGRGPDLDMVRELSDGCFIPITVGGGIKTLDDIRQLLLAGADKVCIGTAAFQGDMTFVRRAAEHFGSQAIVVSFDIKDGGLRQRRYAPSFDDWDVAKYAWQFANSGAGEILLQSIDRDGTMQGYDLDLIREVSAAVSIPVIASGGCSGYQDMLDAIKAGADAVAAGALFSFTDATPRGAAKFLKEAGVPVRL